MGRPPAIAYIDGPRLQRSLRAGIAHLFQRRDYLNKINVFPVPDGDTGTNMAFTFKHILEATSGLSSPRVDELVAVIADAALDGARGNSGAIMAQYLEGIRGQVHGKRLISARRLALASQAGAAEAWKAMSKPVAGTLPTVLEDFSLELAAAVADGEQDIRVLLKRGLDRANASLANTPNQLAVLRQAGVVDAGGQGFVDLIEGIWAYVDQGVMEDLDRSLATDVAAADLVSTAEIDVGKHRFCTECVIEAEAIDRSELMERLEKLDASSLVVAGGLHRVRVHVHVNNPAEVYLACQEFGQIRQQKADDMTRQHGLLNHAGSVIVVSDSGGDIPASEVDRLGIYMVPVRLSFGAQEYIDGVSLTSKAFYSKLEAATEAPLTSQPPAQDFVRAYSLLTSHGYQVVSVGLSARLSGTTAAALQAASQFDAGAVNVIDSLSASSGQGLLAMMAAEAAVKGMTAEEIEALLEEMIPQTRVLAICDDLGYAVRGGRVPSWVKRVTNLLRINPVLTTGSRGELSFAGIIRGTRADVDALARLAVRKMSDDVYRVIISHANDPDAAEVLRRRILEKHGKVHSCHLTDAGPALGVHLGPGALIVAFAPQPDVLD